MAVSLTGLKFFGNELRTEQPGVVVRKYFREKGAEEGGAWARLNPCTHIAGGWKRASVFYLGGVVSLSPVYGAFHEVV
jgi:hypothetical protein